MSELQTFNELFETKLKQDIDYEHDELRIILISQNGDLNKCQQIIDGLAAKHFKNEWIYMYQKQLDKLKANKTIMCNTKNDNDVTIPDIEKLFNTRSLKDPSNKSFK